MGVPHTPSSSDPTLSFCRTRQAISVVEDPGLNKDVPLSSYVVFPKALLRPTWILSSDSHLMFVHADCHARRERRQLPGTVRTCTIPVIIE